MSSRKENQRPVTMNSMIELHGDVQNIRSPSMYMRIIDEIDYIMNNPRATDEMRSYFVQDIQPLLRHYQQTIARRPEREPLKNLQQ